MRAVLSIAGLVFISMGLLSIVAPHLSIRWSGIDAVQPVELWQYMGLIKGVFGIAYLIAAINPYKHWVVVFAGFTVKLLACMGYLCLYASGDLDAGYAHVILIGSVIWLPFFAVILRDVARQPHQDHGAVWDIPPIDEQLERFNTQDGNSLNALSQTTPIMLVFLRHFGSPFCRESLSNISRKRQQIEAAGLRIVLVHMASDEEAMAFFTRYNLDDLPRVSDPQCELYRAFGLIKGSFSQIAGMRIFFKAIRAAFLSRHGLGRITGDFFQMPGVFIIHKSRMFGGYRPSNVSDQPDYANIARWAYHAETGYE